MIEYVETHVVYENPRPNVHSRHGYHPGLAQLASGELIALFLLAEAFEAPNGTTFVARSADLGRTWRLQGPLYDKRIVGFETTDTMKPTVLRDGSLVAVGYRFHRHDLEQPIAIEETGGFLPGDNLVSFSSDDGRTWSVPKVIPRRYPEVLEMSGPCIQLHSGELAASAGFYKMPDGSNPSGRFGVLLRSEDQGRTWDDSICFLRGGDITPWETRICQMPDGRLVIMIWAYDGIRDRHLSNRVTVSPDHGRSWSPLIDTGHMGQASSVISLQGNLLLTIHAHRGEDPGIYVRSVDFSGDAWKLLEEKVIWGQAAGQQTREGQSMVEMFASLRFGQPSLLRLSNGDLLATHWSVENCQGKIRTHRLRVNL